MIGETIKLLRNTYGINSQDLALKIEISQSYMSEIENNKKIPKFEIIKKISEIFKIKTSSLIYIDEKVEEAGENINFNEKIIIVINTLEKIKKGE
ncbi:helix-turn-helix transcriptional regulator [Fusobacterium ulcerans]|uniref:helix-turn-helix transcriptional regulator n=1 Tax=Fusobacterium ulcerans TaxID=861 RepID=UPI00309D14C7